MPTSPAEYNQGQIAAGRLTQEMLAKAPDGIQAIQAFYGLTPDGKAGPKTQAILQALVDGKTPVPYGRVGLGNVYGRFSYKEGPGGRIDPDVKWVAAHIVRVKLHTGKWIRLHAAIADEFVALFQRACEASGYTPESVQTFVPRHTLWDPDKPLSLHSWGIAVDLDPSDNRMGGKDSHGKPSRLRQHPAFVQVFRDAGWVWGGDWDMKDDMHFQRAHP